MARSVVYYGAVGDETFLNSLFQDDIGRMEIIQRSSESFELRLYQKGVLDDFILEGTYATLALAQARRKEIEDLA
jgi:hypothetical protein